MTDPAPITDILRGDFLESRHLGHLVVSHADEGVIGSLGDADKVILPRSSCKMIQALPLVESGAADAARVDDERLALACASHTGAAAHTERVSAWLDDLGLSDDDLRCGPQVPDDAATHKTLLCTDTAPCQRHNNCSGKHTGFLTLTRHLKAGPDYIDPGHPVQQTVKAAFEEVTGLSSPGHAIDGCSAPNFATTLSGLAAAMARFAAATGKGDRRDRAMHRLTRAMAAHPFLVAGEGSACTVLMRAMEGRAVIKTGAEGVYVAILPERRIGIALKVADGTTRAAECTIAAALVQLGVLSKDHPATRRFLGAPIINRRGILSGSIEPAPELLSALAQL